MSVVWGQSRGDSEPEQQLTSAFCRAPLSCRLTWLILAEPLCYCGRLLPGSKAPPLQGCSVGVREGPALVLPEPPARMAEARHEAQFNDWLGYNGGPCQASTRRLEPSLSSES